MIPTGEDQPRTIVWGCVLIGGKSRRMGTPKHLLADGGLLWIERTVDILAQRAERVIVAGSGALPDSLSSLTRVADIDSIAGPLAGILSAFRHYPAVSWLVAACDLPDLEVAALQWLLDQRKPGVLAVLPALTGEGWVEPLLAYYDRQCGPLLEAMADDGHWRMNRLKEKAGVITPQPPTGLIGAWRNVNRPDVLEQYRQGLTLRRCT